MRTAFLSRWLNSLEELDAEGYAIPYSWLKALLHTNVQRSVEFLKWGLSATKRSQGPNNFQHKLGFILWLGLFGLS
jgi:hypothetical protein